MFINYLGSCSIIIGGNITLSTIATAISTDTEISAVKAPCSEVLWCSFSSVITEVVKKWPVLNNREEFRDPGISEW